MLSSQNVEVCRRQRPDLETLALAAAAWNIRRRAQYHANDKGSGQRVSDLRYEQELEALIASLGHRRSASPVPSRLGLPIFTSFGPVEK
jgi:hypothetical protein